MAVSMRDLDPAFQGAGQKAGIEIWRIENFRPVPVPKSSYGKFFTGDSYVILKTTALKSGALRHDIHYWLGKDTSQDEAGAAAVKTVELDAALGGRAVQYREVQGHETEKFLSYFKPCIIPQEGGVASGFKHVQEEEHKIRMFVCRGKHVVHVKEVPFARSSLNHDDIFILDTKSKIFQFNGSNSSIQERAKALEVVQYIKDTYHDGKCEVAAIEDGKLMADAETGEFWGFFGGFAPLPRKTASDEDRTVQSHTAKLLSVEKGQAKPVDADSLTRELLDTNKCYILDCGLEVFVWMGRNTSLDERKTASGAAEELIRGSDRPKSQIIRVIEGFETVVFKSKFESWPQTTNVAVTEDGRSKVAALLRRQGLNVKGLAKAAPAKEEPQPYIDCTGNLQVWRVNGQEKVLLPASDQSKFYSGDCYIFQYSYPGEDKEEYLIGTWIGKQSVEDDRVSAVSLATKMVESMKFQATQACIHEGSEPIQFFSIFQSFIVFKGGLSDGYKNYIAEKEIPEGTYTEDGLALFRVQGSGPDNMQAIQVEAVASSLNSSYCYILHSGSTVFTWAGNLTSPDDHELVERQLDIIKPNLQSKPQKEGSESEQFWELLGGKSEYPSQKIAREPEGDPQDAVSSTFNTHHIDSCIVAVAVNNGDISAILGSNSDQSNSRVVESSPSIMALGGANYTEIDEDLHSRQLAVYGRETMRRLFASNILISGMQGLGAEIAKNLILAGVKSVTLHDEGVVEVWDLSSNFVFSETDVGKNRAVASVQKLQELNNAVIISTLTTKLTKEQLSNFQAVVFTDISFEKAIEFDDYCHNYNPPISFIKAEVRGLFGSIFCDFGPEFTVVDVDGEDPHTGIIASISNDYPAFVSCVDDERLEFQDGDLVVFSEVHGMTELNDGKPRKIKMARPYSFTLEEDTTKFGTYIKGGIVTQVKQPKVLNFKPLREALKDPGEFLLSDFSKFDRPPLLHIAFQALDKFVSDLGRFPVAGSEEDANKLISIAGNINERVGDGKVEDINPKLLRNFAFGARAVLNPMAAMFGGIVGQEVVKACSGKFHPLFQFFYFDSVESLPTEPLDPSDLKPLNTRYDAQISVFGSKLQKKLEDAKVFIVGSGALGCEFLKNIALMGVSCGDQGKLTVTDDDVIEKSNLSRQFLFRDWNIGQAKSTVAASAAASINSRLNIEALQNRVGPETENVFDDTFWENLTVIINALDNVNARLYIDQRCLYFQKPLLESGTLGAKCNTQMVIPHLTENYGASRDPPEKQAPMCTVHSFPHNIDHCLTWARSEFEGLLEKTPAEVNAYLSNPVEYKTAQRNAGDAQARDNLERVLECLEKEKCETFQDCIAWARLRFEDYFVNRVKQLIYTFPEDAATSTGAPFWSAPKRFPQPLQFSVVDPSHLQFVMAASILRAETFGIPIPDWIEHPKMLAEAIEKLIVPDFEPKKDVKIVTDEKATTLSVASIDDAAVIDELIFKLELCTKNLPLGFKMKPIQFEKDDDTNYHMDLIAGLANMRARNYSIPEVDKLKAKFIAGRIIPAIATSTAMATGLVCLELYKALDGGHKLEDYRNTFANLALPLFSMAEPVPPKTIKHSDMSWTVWDRWILKGNPSLRELIQWLKDKGLNAYSISYGSCLLYNSMFLRHRERMDKKMVDLALEVAKAELGPNGKHLDVVVACEDDEDNDIDIPQISIYFA